MNSPSLGGHGGGPNTRGSPFASAPGTSGSGRLELSGLANLPGMYQVRTASEAAHAALRGQLQWSRLAGSEQDSAGATWCAGRLHELVDSQ